MNNVVMSKQVLFPKGNGCVQLDEILAILNDTVVEATNEPPLLTQAFVWENQRRGKMFWRDAHKDYCERGRLCVAARNELKRIYEAFR